MTDPERDIQRLWHEQPLTEEDVMSIDEIRSKAEQLTHKVRRGNIVAATLFAVIIGVEIWQVWREPALVERVGDVLTIAALIYAAYWFRDKVTTQAMPAGLGRTASADFYRSQLARQRDLARRPWRYLVLFVPGVALSLLGRSLERPPAQTAVIVALGIGLFVAVAWVHLRTARKLQREIDDLG
jgi:hypothetical protein